MPDSQLAKKPNLWRWGAVALIVVLVVVAIVVGLGRGGADKPQAGPGEPSAATSAPASPTPTDSPAPTTPGAVGAPPRAVAPTGPVAAGGQGSLVWQLDLKTVTAETNPWVTALVDGSDQAWLMAVSVESAGTGGYNSFFTVLDPVTGEVKVPPGPSDLPGDVKCAAGLLSGQAVCLMDGQVYLVDPATAQVSAEPLVAEPGTLASAVAVDTAEQVVVAGLSALDGVPQVAAYSPQGQELWASPVAVDGCLFNTVDSTSFVTVKNGVLQVGVGQFQAVLNPANGAVLAALCGDVALADNGSLGLMQRQGVEAVAPESYTDAQGVSHRICDLGTANDIIPAQLDGQSYFGVISEDQLLSLVEATDCGLVWSQDTKLSQARFQGYDSQSLYYNNIRGLTAVAVDTGQDRWLWRQGTGVSFRSAYVQGGWAVVLSSKSVAGVDPATGQDAWSAGEYGHGAWYWAAQPRDELQPLVLLDPTRSLLARLDLTP